MQNLSILYIFYILLALALPAAAVALEDGKKRMDRNDFMMWVFGFGTLFLLLSGMARRSDNLIGELFPVIFLQICNFCFYQSLVRRSVDAGFGKWPAYIAIVPGLNLLCILILLLLPSRAKQAV